MSYKIEGIPGDRKDARHAGEIEVLSFNCGELVKAGFGRQAGGDVPHSRKTHRRARASPRPAGFRAR